MSDPLVSLMMIAYNNVAFIKAAIESVRKQTYPHWELIINDDQSSDGTWELAQALAKNDPRIKVFQNHINLKTPGNRAAAAKHMKGDFVGHIDADDMLYPYSVEHMLAVFKAKPNVALAYSDMADINARGQVTGYRANPDATSNLAQHGWRHFGMYRMDAYRRVTGYNDKLTQGCEDGDLFLQIADEHLFTRVPEVLYAYRSHTDNHSSKNYKCKECPDRPVCNYVRIWSRYANYDPITFKPKNEKKQPAVFEIELPAKR